MLTVQEAVGKGRGLAAMHEQDGCCVQALSRMLAPGCEGKRGAAGTSWVMGLWVSRPPTILPSPGQICLSIAYPSPTLLLPVEGCYWIFPH